MVSVDKSYSVVNKDTGSCISSTYQLTKAFHPWPLRWWYLSHVELQASRAVREMVMHSSLNISEWLLDCPEKVCIGGTTR